MKFKKTHFLLPLFLFFGFFSKAQDIPGLRTKAKEVFKIQASSDYDKHNSRITAINNGNYDSDAIDHLKDVSFLARGYASGYPSLASLDFITPINAGLDHFFSLDYANSNDSWHDRKIKAQRELQEISSLYFDQLTAARKTGISAFFWENTINTNKEPINLDIHFTGANKADIATSILAKGLLDYDLSLPANDIVNTQAIDLITTGTEALDCTMGFSTIDFFNDGIREDYSFQQHNNDDYPLSSETGRGLLYAGGYGQSLIHNVAVWGSILEVDDFFILNNEQTFFDFIFEGYRWMVVGNTTDYSANGRYISRKYDNNNAAIDEDDLDLLIGWTGDADGALAEMRDLSVPGSRQNVSGNKYFWKSDFVVHHAAEYVSSIKMCSERTYGTESINGENILGFWLPFGCTYIYRDGNEYIRLETDPEADEEFENIFPCWNWSYVPGVTCSGTTNTDVPSFDGNYSSQSTTFVGTASNENDTHIDNKEFSVTAMDYDITSGATVSAKKSWFHFGDEMVALGSEITGSGLHTTLNQSLYSGTPPVEEEFIPEPVDFPNRITKYFTHAEMAYILPYDLEYFPDGQSWTVYYDNVAGNWADIGDKSGEVDADVFRTWIDHTNENIDSYYYIIAPGKVASDYAENNPITLLKNTAEIQAVKKVEEDGDVLAGIIYYPDPDNPDMEFPSTPAEVAEREVQITPSIKLSTNRPCALLYDGNIGQVCISSPDRNPVHNLINLTIKQTIGTTVTTHVESFNLPDGEVEGTSLCIDLFSIASGNITTHCPLEPNEDGGISEVGIFDTEYPDDPNNALTPISITDTYGNYSNAVLPISTYTIDPKNDGDYYNYRNGVSTMDLLILQRHLLHFPGEEIVSPYIKIAADVNQSGTITSYDRYWITRLLLIEDPWEADSWEFVIASHVFPASPPPYSFPAFPPSIQSIPINGLGASDISRDNDFIGIKMGDLDCDAELEGILEQGQDIIIVIEDKPVLKDEIVKVDLKVENFSQMEAYQLGIEFNSEVLEQQSINTKDLNRAAEIDNFGLTQVEDGKIRTIWLHNDASDLNNTVVDTTLANNSSLFELEFKANMDFTRSSSTSYKLSDLLTLNDDVLANEAYSHKGIHKVKLKFVEEGYFEKIANFSNLLNPVKCFPNPAKEEINFQLDLRQESDVQLQIFDPLGKLVTQEEITLSSGVQVIDIEDIKRWENGMYFYVITVGGDIETGMFVKQ